MTAGVVLGLLGGALLGVGYVRGDLDLVAAGLLLTGLGVVAAVVGTLREGRRR